MMRFKPQSVRDQISSIMAGMGADDATREICTTIMYDTDLMGVDSHGISMLSYYVHEVQAGVLVPDVAPEVVRETGAVALIDSHRGFGHTAGHLAMSKAIEAAQKFGVGIGSVKQSNHYGAAGYYARMAADAGLIGVSMCSTANALQIPHRAKRPLMGTNPIAFAVPVPGENPLLLDMATSVVPLNKVKVYGLKGEELPAAWVQSEDGRVITDSTAAYEQMEYSDNDSIGLLPLGGETFFGGGQKGSGLATMVQVLSAALSGSDQPGNVDGYQSIGYFFLAIDPDLVGSREETYEYVRTLRNTIRGMEPVDPDLPVQAMGDRDFDTRAERSELGIPLADKLVEQLRGLATELDAEFTLEEQA
ncbi:Ldh family oxidoreductase [Brevibacterium moorei]|uniref:Ldh family oxidoreductase n=1 Tax=Brevibacterium moorei TaxID=2968457 RepID=UPI00211C981E|nr:Ldh family oxidoreductase [Brevibacterium sp. 68QC2CO]MCQ9385781.1 Ldh family oxidoreductase [Brevibacterium sp. 68QC2CO]